MIILLDVTVNCNPSLLINIALVTFYRKHPKRTTRWLQYTTQAPVNKTIAKNIYSNTCSLKRYRREIINVVYAERSEARNFFFNFTHDDAVNR